MYAFDLMWMERTGEALTTMKRGAADGSAFAPEQISNLSLIYFSAHQYSQALEQCRKTLEMDPNFPVARYRLGRILSMEGHNAEAVPELEKVITMTGSPRAVAQLGFAYTRLGRKNDARTLLNDLKEKSRRYYVSAFNLATIYAGLGERERESFR